MRNQSLFVVFVFLSSAMLAMAETDVPKNNSQPPKLPIINTKAECIASSGTWGWNGIPHMSEPSDGEGFCILSTTDAGKPCSSSSECQSECEATQDSPQTGKGVCTSTNFTAGCRSWVQGGVTTPVICSD
jgi:hypothetical protein